MSGTFERPELPPEIKAQVDDLLRRCGIAERAGNFEESERLALEAWDALPEPKLGWEFYSDIMPRDNLLFFRDTKQFDKALHWLDITRQTYKSTPERPQPMIEFYAATLFFEMGRLDEAFAIFDWQYKNWKTRPFQGKDKKYIDFYLSRKGRK